MDIVQVLGISLSATLEEAKLNINSVLANPLQDKALEKLEKSIRDFTLAKMQLDTVTSLQKQVADETAKAEQ